MVNRYLRRKLKPPRVPGVVSKALVNADGTPFAEVEINQAVVYKKDNVSPIIQALMELVNSLRQTGIGWIDR